MRVLTDRHPRPGSGPAEGPPPPSAEALLVRVVLLLCLLATAAWADWSYDVTANPDNTLNVTATIGQGADPRPWLDDALWACVHDLQLQASDNTWQPCPRPLPGAGPWTLRYRFDLPQAARQERSYRSASQHGRAILTTPSTFLVRPAECHGERYRITAHGTLLCAATEGTGESLDHAPAAVVGNYQTHDFPVSGGVVTLAYQPVPVSEPELLKWVNLSVTALADYYGRLPSPRVLLVIFPHDGRGVRGMAMGNSVIMLPPKSMPAAELRNDWTLMHELSHLGFPGVPYKYHWIEEGLATYLEPIIRVRAGDFPKAQLWKDIVENMPASFVYEVKNHDYNRYYWGGALYWFLADLRIRLNTGKTLQTALQAIVAKGGNLTEDWPLETVLQTGDEAIGKPILRETLQTKEVDLRYYWRQLGLDPPSNDAPWARIRDAVTENTTP